MRTRRRCRNRRATFAAGRVSFVSRLGLVGRLSLQENFCYFSHLSSAGYQPSANLNSYSLRSRIVLLHYSEPVCDCRYNLGISCVNLKAHREACEHFLTALNFQAAGRGPQGEISHSVMSENIWSSLRLCMSLMDRQDLYHDVDMRNLDSLSRVFDVDNAQK